MTQYSIDGLGSAHEFVHCFGMLLLMLCFDFVWVGSYKNQWKYNETVQEVQIHCIETHEFTNGCDMLC